MTEFENYLINCRKAKVLARRISKFELRLKKLDQAIEVLDCNYHDPAVAKLCEYWDITNKLVAKLRLKFANVSLELAEYEAKEAFKD